MHFVAVVTSRLLVSGSFDTSLKASMSRGIEQTAQVLKGCRSQLGIRIEVDGVSVPIKRAYCSLQSYYVQHVENRPSRKKRRELFGCDLNFETFGDIRPGSS